MRSFSLYLHIPYCQAKCPYCDFNSHAAQQWPEQRYVDALRAEMRHYAQQAPWAGGEIGTIFFGGGTPSLFAAASIGNILNEAAQLWPLAPDIETTLEANPGTITLDKLAGFRAADVNRMSFGVQSFAAHHLRTLGRIHDANEAKAAVTLARQAGFSRVSIDLIFALPNQTLDEWEADLAQACGLEPDHISAYNLTYEEGTPFHHWRAQGLLRQLPEEIEVAMFTRTREILAAARYDQYEISNYARPGQACRHNLNYWHSGPYLGVGAGAHSYAERFRWSNEKSPTKYLRDVEAHGHARVFEEALDERQARGEFVFLGLRCLDGFSGALFRERFGDDFPMLYPHVSDLRDGGLLEFVAGHWRLTPPGVLLADSVFVTFL